jgi:hypothetical protein
MIKRLISQLALVSALSLISMSASGAVVNAVLTINNAIFTDLWSTTLDNGGSTTLPNPSCTSLSGEALEKCQFLGGEVPATGRLIEVANNGYNLGLMNGILDVDYEDTTGEIIQVNTLQIYLQDLTVSIPATSTVVSIINGNGMGVTNCFILCTPVAVANEQGEILAGVTTTRTTNPIFPFPGAGTADADQAVSNSDANIFHHRDLSGFTDVPDFSTFEDITDSCTGGSCNLVAALSLDGDGYRLDGNLSSFGTNFTLTSQTLNNSVYTVDFTTVVPVPAAVWLFGSALGLLGFLRRRLA